MNWGDFSTAASRFGSMSMAGRMRCAATLIYSVVFGVRISQEVGNEHDGNYSAKR
jgi:hypothetical protein